MGQIGYNNYLTVPSRCEKFFYVKSKQQGDCVIENKELCEGVFLAGMIATVTNGFIPIKILNTRDEEVKLSYFNIETYNLDSYDICTFEKEYINAERVKKLFSMLNLDHLNSFERKEIESICAKFPDVFYLPGDKLGYTNMGEQKIHLKENITPVYTKPYRLPYSQKQEIDRQIKKMLDENIIEEAQSEWSSPLLLVPKKSDDEENKKWRVVIDYRKVNERVKEDKFPLPNITEILDSLSGAIYFTHLDMNQGYYQVKLDQESRKYTAFTTNNKQYQLKRLPMGLKISPNAFSRIMTIALSGLNYEKCFVYLDDLVCFGRNLQQHNQHLMDILSRLRKVNLKLNPAKCQFLKKEMLYLGHVISEKGILPDPNKTKALQNYPKPVNSDEVRRFVAFANYYRKLIPCFAEICIPLNKLLRKGSLFEWTEECERAFEKLKSALISPPVLQYPDFSQNNEFILHTDASGIAIGSMLCNSNNMPIAYASRSLNKAELNYPTIEKELLAIVWSIKYFRPYLYGRRFKIMTDHRPLVYLFNMSNPASRLLKFRLSLEEYDFNIEYVKGANNVAADALSRVVLSSEDLKEMNERIVNVMTRSMQKKESEKMDTNCSDIKRSNNDWTDHPRVVDILKKPNNCVEITITSEKEINQFRKKGLIQYQTDSLLYVPSKLKLYVNPASRALVTRVELVRELSYICSKLGLSEVYIVKDKDNYIFIKELTQEIKRTPNWEGPQLCVVKGVQKIENIDDIKVILNDFHLLPTSGHAGIRRMLNNIRRFYFWPSMHKDVEKYVRTCEKCQKEKYSVKTKQPMVITTTALSAFDKIFLDIVGPLNKDYSNNVYILTLQCELTKFTEAFPLESKDTASVAKAFVENFILRYGVPKEIATDRGSEFISSTMSEVCKLLNITQTTSTAYHHESIGALENSHKVLGTYLRINTNNYQTSWSSWLPYWCFSYNNTVHTETKYTPHELVFGKICNIPSNLKNDVVEPLYNSEHYPLELKYRLQLSNKDARENLLRSKEKRKEVYDINVKPMYYNKDNLILIRNPSNDKKESIYLGPYTVVEDRDPNVVILKNGKEEIVHKNRTKLFLKE